MRAPNVSTPTLSLTPILAWARDAFQRLEVPDGAASVRVRLQPSPRRGESLVLVPYENGRDLDRALDELETALAELATNEDLPDPVKVRIEVLDGTGEPIRGAGATKTFRGEPMAQQQATTATTTRPGTIDADWEPAELTRPMRGAFDMAAQLAGDEGAVVPVRLLVGVLLWDRLVDLEERRQQRHLVMSLAAENRLMSDVLRRGQAGILEHAETMGALALDAIPRAARAEADVELADLKARGEAEPKSKLREGVDLLNATAHFFKSRAEAEALVRSKGSGRPRGQASPTKTETPSAPSRPADATPDPAPAAPPAEAPALDASALLSALLSPETHASQAAQILQGLAGMSPGGAERLQEIARALLPTESP